MKKIYNVSNTIKMGTEKVRRWSRITTMNHRICSVIAPMLFVAFGLFGVNEKAWGNAPDYQNGTWYSLYDTSEKSAYIATIWSSPEIAAYDVYPPTNGNFSIESKLPGSGSAKGKTDPAGYGVHNYQIEFGGITLDVIHNISTSRSNGKDLLGRYTWSYTYNYRGLSDSGIDTDVTSVTASYVADGSHHTAKTVYVQNAKIEMAPHIRLKSSSTTNNANKIGVTTQELKAFGNTNVESLSSDNKTVYFRSFLTSTSASGITIRCKHYPTVFRLGTSDNTKGENYPVGANMFAYESGSGTCSAGSAGSTDKYKFNVYFRPEEAKVYKDTIIITDGTNYAYVYISGTGVLNDNIITWTPDTISKKDWNGTLTANATATNTNYSGNSNSRAITYTVESGKESYVTIADGKITFNQAGAGQSVKITATQEANYKYKKATLEKTFTIKKTQSIVWDQEKVNTNIRLNKTRDIADYTYAEPSGDRTISYSSANSEYISVSGTVLTAKKVGKVNIIATLAGDADYNEVTSSKEFEVKEKEAVVFRLGEAIITDDNDDLAFTVGQTSAVITSNNTDTAIRYTTKDAGVAIFNTTTKRIEAKGEGSATITLLQDPTDDYLAGTRTLNITVSLNPTTITANVSETTMEVGGEYDPKLSTTNDEVDMTITTKKSGVVAYEDGKLKALGAGKDTITFTQAKTTKWAKGEKSIIVTVNKKNPTLSITGVTSPAWNTTIEPTISSTNTDPNCAITITKVSGSDAAARIFGSTIKVYDKHGENFIFKVSQAGNNTYNSVNKNCTIQVRKPNNHVTYVKGNVTLSKDQSEIIGFTGVPAKVQFTPNTDASADREYKLYWSATENGDYTPINSYSYTYWSPEGSTTLEDDIDPSAKFLKVEFTGAWNLSKSGTFKNLTITERKEILVNGLTNNYYDFGTWEVGNQATDRAIGIKWYSVPTTTVTSSNPGVFDVITETVNSEIDDFSESASIIIRYHHKRVTPGTQDEATITLTSENGYSTSFKVKGKTIKKNQTLIWQDELSPVEVGTVIPNAAIAPLALNYSITSTTAEGVVDLDGTVLKAQKVGTVTIHVANDGDEMWNPISGECTIKVTDLKVQHIRWNENFKRLTTSDADQELKATAYEYVNGEEVPITARSITYKSSNTGVVSIVNGKLHVVGVGTATLTASLDGVDGVYEPASVTRNVKVRDKSTGCVPYAIENESANMKTHIYDFTGTEKTYSLNGVEPASLTFTAWRENILGVTGGNIFVAESKDNGSNWTELREFSISEGESNATTCGPVALSREATNIKIYKKTGATGYHNFKDLDVTKAKYLELDDTKDKTTMSVSFPAEETHIGQTYIKSVVVNYSNIYDMLYVNHTNPNFRITPTEIGERCGEDGRATITIIYYAKEAISESDVITITDEHGLTATINVSAAVDKNDQTITWDPTTELNTTDDVTFDATASSGLAVKYELAEDDADIATLTEDGKLTIKTAGYIHVTASQAGSKLYNEVELEPVTIHISKVTPSVSVSPSVAAVTLPKTLSEVTLNTSEAKMVDDKGAEVAGTYAWVDSTTVLTSGSHDYSVRFTPTKDAWYNVAEFEVSVTASKRDQVITWGVEDNQKVPCSAIIPLNAVLTDDYSHKVMEESLTYESSNEACAEIIGGELVVKTPGTTTITVSRAEDATYNAASITRTITFEKATPVIDTLPKALSIYEEQWLRDAALSGGYVRSGERKIQGGFVWTTEDFQATVVGTQEYDAVFIPANEACYDRVTCKVPMTVLQVERVFTNKKGDNDWNNPENWSNGFVPPVANVEVTINENVIISDTVSVGTMTINEGVTVTVTSQLTVSGNQETENGKYGDIVVKETGELIVNNTFKVNNFSLDAKLGNTSTAAASGQVSNGDNLDIQGDVYFQLAVDPSGRNTYGWYDFVVPFEVDVIGGISIAEDPDAEMKFNVNYAVMAFDESKRAVRGKDWNKFTGTMQPGRVYTITLDETKPWNTVVFKKKKGASLTGDRSFTTSYSSTLGEEVDRGWNGFGNGSLFHAELAVDDPETLVQIYDHKNKCYQARPVKDYSIAVGTSFFMQVGSVQTITLATADEKNTGFMAPARSRKTVEKFKMSLMNYDADEVYDYMWVGANEDATEAYVIGDDVLKMGTLTESNIARMWTTKGGHNLCAVETALINDEASTPLAIYAPKAGSYWFAIDEAPEDATLYLTYNDEIIWDLTISPYLFDLSKGTTAGYGLRIETKKAPAITTEVEQSEISGQSSVRKVIIDNKVYIVTPDGKMYDVIGKGIKF